MDSVPRDVNEISGTDSDDFVAEQMGDATFKHVDPLLIFWVIVRRRCLMALVGYDANLN